MARSRIRSGSVDLLAYANDVIDQLRTDTPVNRPIQQLSVIGDDLAVVESFSHVWVVRTEEGLVLFDVSSAHTAARVLEAIRTWTSDPVHTVVYTHGHADHVGGAGVFLAEAEAAGARRPRFVGHANVAPRLARYRLTNGYNVAINRRQFAPSQRRRPEMGIGQAERFIGDEVPDPDLTYGDELAVEVGGERFVIRHDRGETDDHSWTEWEGRGVLFVGDLLIWNFPNCGNPQKVLRYPTEWAAALRRMAARQPGLVGPAHGLPVAEAARVGQVLGTTATALEGLVRDVLDILNADGTMEDALHSVRVPDELLALPWLRPFYDEPEFVVRNIWRTYGGWWDGNPARLLPARQRDVAAEVAALAGGALALARRARSLGEQGELRVACELVEMAALVAPDDPEVHEARMHVYVARRRNALSLMAKGIFEAAVTESAAIAGIEPPALARARVL